MSKTNLTALTIQVIIFNMKISVEINILPFDKSNFQMLKQLNAEIYDIVKTQTSVFNSILKNPNFKNFNKILKAIISAENIAHDIVGLKSLIDKEENLSDDSTVNVFEVDSNENSKLYLSSACLLKLVSNLFSRFDNDQNYLHYETLFERLGISVLFNETMKTITKTHYLVYTEISESEDVDVKSSVRTIKTNSFILNGSVDFSSRFNYSLTRLKREGAIHILNNKKIDENNNATDEIFGKFNNFSDQNYTLLIDSNFYCKSSIDCNSSRIRIII